MATFANVTDDASQEKFTVQMQAAMGSRNTSTILLIAYSCSNRDRYPRRAFFIA